METIAITLNWNGLDTILLRVQWDQICTLINTYVKYLFNSQEYVCKIVIQKRMRFNKHEEYFVSDITFNAVQNLVMW